MSRKIIFTIMAALLVAVGGLWLVWQRPSANVPGITPVQAATTASTAASVDTSLVKDMTIGNPDAKVKLLEYGSFTCPHCREFHNQVFDKIKKNYIDTGKIQFTYREVYFDRFGLWAGLVARCGGGLRYFGLVDLIYEHQNEWTRGTPAQIAGNLKKLGRQAGLGNKQLDTCMQDSAMAKAMVVVYQKNQARDKIKGTPSFFINGKEYPNMRYAGFVAALDKYLGK